MLAEPASAAGLALLATALVVAPGRGAVRYRLRQLGGRRDDSASAPTPGRSAWLPVVAGLGAGAASWAVVGGVAGVVVGSGLAFGAAIGCRLVLAGRRAAAADPLQLAGACDLLAACLRAGLPVVQAVQAVAEQVPAQVGGELRRAAQLLALGADPDTAWQACTAIPTIDKVARAARRSSATGADLARVAAAAAAEARAAAADNAEAGAQRAGVLVAGPLGVCFLPAFLCLGVIPVVIGLADGLMTQW